MLEYIREQYNFTPIPLTLNSRLDPVTPVPGAGINGYYISVNGGGFEIGTGRVLDSGGGWYSLVLGVSEQVAGPRLISIPCGPISDPLYFRVFGTMNLESYPVPQYRYYPMTFRMISSVDHMSSAPDVSPVVTLSRDGSSFTTVISSVMNIGRGCYTINIPTAGEVPPSDQNNEAVYLVRAIATGADVTYDRFQVFRYQYPA